MGLETFHIRVGFCKVLDTGKKKHLFFHPCSSFLHSHSLRPRGQAEHWGENVPSPAAGVNTPKLFGASLESRGWWPTLLGTGCALAPKAWQ